MSDEEFRARLKELYLPTHKDFSQLIVPRAQYATISGEGRPPKEELQAATKYLFTAIYPIKREVKKKLGKNWKEPPLESLWWTTTGAPPDCGPEKDVRWKLMIVVPEWLDKAAMEKAVEEVRPQLGEANYPIELEFIEEGSSVQIMSIGPYEGQKQILDKLHQEYLPSQGLVASGPHHEIYLNDPSRVAKEKLRTVLRQPVQRQEAS